MDLKLSRRAFLALLLSAGLALVLLRLRGVDLAERIRAFYAIEGRHAARLRDEVAALRRKSLLAWAASVAFFSLDGSLLARLVPRPARRAVVEHWSRRLLAPRSIGWPWLGYPQVADDAVCDGLVKGPA